METTLEIQFNSKLQMVCISSYLAMNLLGIMQKIHASTMCSEIRCNFRFLDKFTIIFQFLIAFYASIKFAFMHKLALQIGLHPVCE